MSKTNEWNLSKDARADKPSVDPETEKIFDMEFRRRFGELINQIREPSTQTRDIGPSTFHRDLLSE